MPATKKSLHNKAKVGIFMPCYNMGKFLEESLDSLQSQTFTDFYVIIADDASTSKESTDALKKVNMPRCEVYFEKDNLGLIKIANKYMSMLDADYIMLFSPDDKMHPDFLHDQVQYLDDHPNVHAVCTSIQEFGEGNDLIKYNDADCRLPEMLVSNNFSGAALIRKTAWLSAGMHDTNPELYPNLDYDLWISMLEKGFVLKTIPKTLFYWRVVKKSLSHDVDMDRQLTFRRALLKKYSGLYKKYSEYVIAQQLETIRNFEEYYKISEEGHVWLDDQYKRLTSANAELLKEKTTLAFRLERSIERPYIRSILAKTRHRLRQRF
ncbi:MAG TPA: glycosyltransferase family A protein [Candidatus Saccharimonadales bacterium]|nr:glycosyltransferase family A protein [Candidatus Saccharimonadales bacterium]